MIIFANNAVTTLAVTLLSGQTTLTVLATTGELFPVPGVDEYFKLTLEDRRNRTIEICHCTGRSGDVLTIVRAQEDTTALNFAVGSTVANRFTRDSADAIIDQFPSPNPWYLGPFATPPTLDNEGGPLVTGMKYFDTTDNIEYTWNGSSWIDTMGGTSAITSLSGTYRLQDPSAGFDGVEDDFNLRYIDYAAALQTPDVTIAEQFIVMLDGVMLKSGTDYTIPVLGTIHFTTPPASDVSFLGVWVALTAAGVEGDPGPQGDPGLGVPTGGTAGQVLAKIDAADNNTQWATIPALTDGDKGDITVSGSGAVWTIDASSVTLAKMANIATGSILGRVTAATGVVEVLTPAQVKTLLAIVKADISDFAHTHTVADLSNASANGRSLISSANYASMRGLLDLEDGTDFYSISGANAAFQPKDTDLTTIAGLTATTDSFMQSKSSAWASRTVAQVKTDLGLTGTNSGDQTSIVGITGTKAQFDTAVTDANLVADARQVISGGGLSGGGDLSVDRTLAVGAGALIQVNADTVEVIVASQAEAEAGTVSTKAMTPERTAQAIAALGTGGLWELIEEKTAAAAATIDFINLGGYRVLKFTFINIMPSVNDREFAARISLDNGANFIATNTYFSNSISYYRLTAVSPNGVGNGATDGGLAGEFTLYNFNVAQKTRCVAVTSYGIGSGNDNGTETRFSQSAQTAMDAVRFLFNSGNISGTIICEGIV